MTDQQYTPTTDDILRCYMQRGGSEEEFNRWYEAEMAAAEQRGAARALREAAIEISDRDGSTARGIIWSDRDSIVSWLRNRADQIEGQDD